MKAHEDVTVIKRIPAGAMAVRPRGSTSSVELKHPGQKRGEPFGKNFHKPLGSRSSPK